jgi:hypothetical protein
MAIVTGFRRVTKNRVGHARETECGYTVVDIDGTRYLLIESYGSPERDIPGKISQSLHLSREQAANLKALLESSFPGV